MPAGLRRSAHNRMFAGVCGGLGEYLRVDPTFVRLLFIFLAFFGGLGVLAYLVLVLLMPPESTAERPVTVAPDRGRELVAYALIVIGGLWLLQAAGVFRFIDWRYVWPVALIAGGVMLLVLGGRR